MTVPRPRLALGGVRPVVDVNMRTEVKRRLDLTLLHLLATLNSALNVEDIDTLDVSRLSSSVATILAEWRREAAEVPEVSRSDLDEELVELLSRHGIDPSDL